MRESKNLGEVNILLAGSLVACRWIASILFLVSISITYCEATETVLPRVLITIAKLAPSAPDIIIPGDVQARYQSNISFRVGGRIAERRVEIGAHVGADDVLARIEPEQQQADMRDAEAALASAEASYGQAKLTFARQQELMKSRFTTQTTLDQAEQQLRVTQGQVESNRAKVGSMKEQLSYTELKAGVAGIVTARNAETGQVVKQGDTVFTIAQDGDRDAVFNVYEGLVAKPPARKDLRVVLIADPSVTTTATLREVSPTVDSKTGAVKVKTTLKDVPKEMTLGASVLGIGNLDASPAVTLPWRALFRWQGKPALWIVDPKDETVSIRAVVVESYADDGMVLREGVAAGDRVVTAGIQFLSPGRKVAVVDGTPP